MHLKGLARGEQEGTVTSVTWAHGPRTSDEANGTSGDPGRGHRGCREPARPAGRSRAQRVVGCALTVAPVSSGAGPACGVLGTGSFLKLRGDGVGAGA